MSERRTYEQRKVGTLRLMYQCRQQVVWEKRTFLHPSEDISWAYGEGEYLEFKGLDLLIRNVIYLVISCAASEPTSDSMSEGRTRIRTEVQSVLDSTPINELLADIPADEASDIRYDLEILGFIPPDITKPQWG
jgi:hypothetical protein